MTTLASVSLGALSQTGGDTEGGRLVQIQAAARRCATLEAIQKARASCCPSTPVSRKQVPLESTNLEGRLAACYRQTTERASFLASQPLRGVPESVRIAQLQQNVLDDYAPQTDPARRFLEYRGPNVAVVCPPMPTEITNANLPKPSTRCDTLALLATGNPPNSITGNSYSSS
jgi:hypothetical protein